MTMLVTGGGGQLARALEETARISWTGTVTVHRVGRPEFDFDRPETIDAVLARVKPSVVVNAAAYTAVDLAERDEAAAMRANCEGPERLARACARAGIPLIHMSTDYVFDGLKGAPYAETDSPNPMGVYAASKLAGEHAVLAACPRAVVLRTSWVYGATGRNFVLTMLNAAARNSRLRVVADQRGCPSAAADLAYAIISMVTQIEGHWSDAFAGVFHAAGIGATTWHGLAVAVFEEAARHGVPRPEVDAITSDAWPTPARRPPDSRLDCSKLWDVYGVSLPHWRGTLTKVIDQVFTVNGHRHDSMAISR